MKAGSRNTGRRAWPRRTPAQAAKDYTDDLGLRTPSAPVKPRGSKR